MGRSVYKSITKTEPGSQLKVSTFFFWPGIVRWSRDLIIAGALAVIHTNTTLKIRFLSTAEWATFKAIGDRRWSSAEIIGAWGEDVTAEVIDNALHLSQPLQNAISEKIVELQATVTFNNFENFRTIARRLPRVFSAQYSESMVQFGIDKGVELRYESWTHIQLQNDLGSTPVTVANYWWNDILYVSAPVKQVEIEYRSVFSRVEGFCDNPIASSTMQKKVLFGYQGWFGCPEDGSDMNKWIHWYKKDEETGNEYLSVDFWPDMREYEEDERFDTPEMLPGGAPATVFSSYNQKTVFRHFKWLKDYDLDGVFAQRFVNALMNKRNFMFRNKVLQNVQLGAERNGRVFAVMYDIGNGDNIFSRIVKDWQFLRDDLHIMDSPAYLHHNGNPVVAIWGPGFYHKDNIDAAETALLISWFKTQNVTVMGGVPRGWREQEGNAKREPEWAAVFRTYDIISPWTVNSYKNSQGLADYHSIFLRPDLEEVGSITGLDYMPVIWPGFSWKNLFQGVPPLNDVPRDGGRFYNMQSTGLLSTPGVNMIYIAMFDEVDEGTAMFKVAEDASSVPVGVDMVTLDADGCDMRSDRFLELAQMTTQNLRSQ